MISMFAVKTKFVLRQNFRTYFPKQFFSILRVHALRLTCSAGWCRQVVFMIQFFNILDNGIDDSMTFVAVKIAASCLAYMNSCVNPILYAFLSENFRKGFWRLIPCVQGSGFAPLRKMEVERTSARYAMKVTTEGRGACKNGETLTGTNDGVALSALGAGEMVDTQSWWNGRTETSECRKW